MYSKDDKELVEEVLSFLKSEVRYILKDLKSNKVVSPDEIRNEELKLFADEIK